MRMGGTWLIDWLGLGLGWVERENGRLGVWLVGRTGSRLGSKLWVGRLEGRSLSLLVSLAEDLLGVVRRVCRPTALVSPRDRWMVDPGYQCSRLVRCSPSRASSASQRKEEKQVKT